MTTLEERFQKGTEINAKMGGGVPSQGSVPASRDLAPDLHRIAREALFGSIWSRTALKIEHREMSTLSVLTALERHKQLREHINSSLNLGLTPEQIIEVFIQVSLVSGIPTAMNALGIAKEVFDQRGIQFTPQQVYDPAEDPEVLYQRGMEKRRELLGDTPFGSEGGPITNAERDFNRLSIEYAWGSIWTRPFLDLQSRCICTLSGLTAVGRERQIRSHIRGALGLGFTNEQIIEIFFHASFYTGIPAAREAIETANEVFQEG